MTTKKASDALQKLLMDESLRTIVQEVEREDRAAQAQRMRGDGEPEWLNSFFESLSSSGTLGGSKLIDPETGKPHTVESMVNEYNRKIGLSEFIDSGKYAELAKSASQKIELPMNKAQIERQSIRDNLAPNADWEDVASFIEREVKSHRGYVDAPAIIYDIRDIFGDDAVGFFGKKIIEEIEAKVEIYQDDSEVKNLSEDGSGEPQRDTGSQSEEDQLFQSMKAAL